MSYDLMFKQANDLYSAGQLDKAEQLYRAVLEAVPENPDVLNMLGLTAQTKGLHQEAISYFLQAVKSSPNHIALYFNLAVSYQSIQKFAQAINAYEKVISLNPNIKETYNNLGAIYECLNQPQIALQMYQNALKSDADYIDAKVNIAVLNKDLKELENLCRKYPLSELAFYYTALHFLEQKDFNKACEYILKADEICDNSPDIKLLKAKINLLLNNIQSAVEDFSSCINLNPKCVEAWVNLADLEENEQYYLKALDLDPENIVAHSNYANWLYQQNRTLEALEEYRKAVIINPDLPELSNNLALVLKDMADYERALDLMMNAFVKDVLQKQYWINIAETLVLFYQTEPEKAKKIAQKWHDLAPSNPFAKHMVSSFNADIKNFDTSYAQELFDLFAETYDQTMKKIKYAVFDKLSELDIKFSGTVLDLGCGTGEFALHFANDNTKITGVDISENMLNLAGKKQLYHNLIKADISDFIKKGLKYNFIVVLDVFEYVQNIEEVLSSVKCDTLIFNIEKADSKNKTYELCYNGRIRHNPEYIKNILLQSGYTDIKDYEFDLRQENSAPVKGVLFIAKK
ncbi:MAG: tetratricopeptide repeat protein [Alphaproteobacteria bacterium]|nr:tetratricopeptide repeat protein [Alphaproteobacteria bacterium]